MADEEEVVLRLDRGAPAGVMVGGRSMRERYGIRGEEYLLCPDIYPPTKDKENFSHPLNMGRASNFGGSFAVELSNCVSLHGGRCPRPIVLGPHTFKEPH